MGVEIVIHKNDLLGQRVMHVDQFAHDLGIIFGGAPFANADMALAFQRYKEHEHVGYTCALILVVAVPRVPGRDGKVRAFLSGQLP